MTALADLYTALAAHLNAELPDEVNVYKRVASGGEWPAVFVHPPAIEYEGLALDDADLRFEVVVMVSAADDTNQLALLPYMDLTGPSSIPAALQANRSLGLGDVDAFVARCRPLGIQEQNAYKGYGAAFEISLRLA